MFDDLLKFLMAAHKEGIDVKIGVNFVIDGELESDSGDNVLNFTSDDLASLFIDIDNMTGTNKQ